MPSRDQLITAVRKDSLVGKGSCSSIDECYDDSDLWEVIEEAKSEAEAVRLARECEGLFLEQGLNCRWGEDDDPQLKAYRDFERECEDNPVEK